MEINVAESCGIFKIPHDSWESWGTQVSIVKNSKIPGNLGIQRYAILGFLTILPYKAAYLSAIRIIEIDFDTKDKNEILTFENKKFKKVASGMEIVKEIGLYMGDKSVRNNKRMAIFFPQEGLLCFLRSYSSYSSNGVTYRIMRKKKRETP